MFTRFIAGAAGVRDTDPIASQAGALAFGREQRRSATLDAVYTEHAADRWADRGDSEYALRLDMLADEYRAMQRYM